MKVINSSQASISGFQINGKRFDIPAGESILADDNTAAILKKTFGFLSIEQESTDFPVKEEVKESTKEEPKEEINLEGLSREQLEELAEAQGIDSSKVKSVSALTKKLKNIFN